MKYILKTIALCSLTTVVFSADKAQWSVDFDVKKSSLITSNIHSPQANLNKQAISYSYPLDANEKLNFDVVPYEEKSKQYWIDSTGSKLVQGIKLPVTGGNTVIRISPLTNDKSIQLETNMISIQNNGKDKELKVFADNAQLKATGAAFSENTVALMINANAGDLNLKVNSFADKTPFVIHVLEPNSDYVLSLKTTQSTFNVNQKISINTSMTSNKNNLNAEIQGYISRPDGSVLGDLDFSLDNDGNYKAEIDAIGSQGLVQGLWEVHVFAKSQDKGVEVMRDAQTSFAIKLNTAQFDGHLNMKNESLKVGIDVGLEGRYEVRGVIMGTDALTFEQKPIAMTMSAAWLAKGKQEIALSIDENLIKKSKLIAPYSIKNVQLNNQTFLAPVQSVKSGIDLL